MAFLVVAHRSSPAGRRGSRDWMRLCAASARGTPEALTDTLQTWQAPTYSARRPLGCKTRRSRAGRPDSVSARVALTATTAAALRVKATCTAWPATAVGRYTPSKRRQHRAIKGAQGAKPGRSLRWRDGDGAHLWQLTHMRTSDDEAPWWRQQWLITVVQVAHETAANWHPQQAPQP